MAETVSGAAPVKEPNYRLPSNRPAQRKRSLVRAARQRGNYPQPIGARFHPSVYAVGNGGFLLGNSLYREWEDYLPLAKRAMKAFEVNPSAPCEVWQQAPNSAGPKQVRLATTAIDKLLQTYSKLAVLYSGKSEPELVATAELEPIVGWVSRDRRGQRIDLVTATIELSPRLA